MANRPSGRWRWTRRLAEAMSAGLLLASPASHAADQPPLILARAGESNAASAPLQLYLEVSLNHTALSLIHI